VPNHMWRVSYTKADVRGSRRSLPFLAGQHPVGGWRVLHERPSGGESCRARDDVPVMGGSRQQVLEALGALLRAERLARGLSLRELAARTRVSNAYLSELERGRHEPSLSVLRAIASALGAPLGPMLVRAGVLEEGEPGDSSWDTETAIERDPALTEPQRIALLSVYRSFVPGRRTS
jgi:transcriptional regulator with XRE-family HTH domain